MFEYKSFLALKGWVYLSWIFLWNIIFGIAIYINGGLGPITNTISLYISAFALIITSIFCFYILCSNKFRLMVIHPQREKDYDSAPFFFIGSITLILGVVFTLNAFIE